MWGVGGGGCRTLRCLLIVSNRTSFSNPHPTSIHTGDTDILFSLQAKNLGVTLTNNLSMEKHVTNICRSAYIEIRRISNIRHFLTIDATKPLLCAFVMSKLDYCNSLLSGSPKHLLDKLQNSATRLVFKARKHEHIKPLLQKLHWLPIVSRIQYKVATLCYNYFTESYPVLFLSFSLHCMCLYIFLQLPDLLGICTMSIITITQ